MVTAVQTLVLPADTCVLPVIKCPESASVRPVSWVTTARTIVIGGAMETVARELVHVILRRYATT